MCNRSCLSRCSFLEKLALHLAHTKAVDVSPFRSGDAWSAALRSGGLSGHNALPRGSEWAHMRWSRNAATAVGPVKLRSQCEHRRNSSPSILGESAVAPAAANPAHEKQGSARRSAACIRKIKTLDWANWFIAIWRR